MCGVVGAIGNYAPQFSHKDIEEVIGHRGPDSNGIEKLNIGGIPSLFGHSRLSIVDLSSAGAQPMYSKNKKWLIVYNGEIYNHKNIRKDIDINFTGHSDTETLVEALAHWGIEKTLSMINGIFAFAAYDIENNAAYLVRDAFGVKPLYYHHGANGLAFASEVRALKRISGQNFGLNRDALHSFLALRFTPSPETLYEGVARLPPGSLARYDCTTGELIETRYIVRTSGAFKGSVDDAVEAYHDILSSAVKRQLLSDVRFGVFLSGGVDSALVAALARENVNDLMAFTVGFGAHTAECEIAPASHTARVLGISHEHVLVDEQMSWDALAPAIAHVEEPLGTTSILPMWYLSALAGKHVKTVLTGQGSDEPWGGYQRYKGVLLSEYLPKSALWGEAWRVIAPCVGHHDALERAMRSLTRKDEAERFMEVYAMFTARERAALLATPENGDISARLRDWLHWYDPHKRRTSVERMMGVDCRMNLADDLLLYGDKISMAHSVEARVPILDMEVVDFIDSLPRPYRLSIHNNKIVHKRTAEKYLPREIVNRPKLGFNVPVASWLRGAWREKAREVLLGSGKIRDLVDQKAVASLWEAHQSGRVNRERQLFALLGLAMWAEEHLGESGTARA